VQVMILPLQHGHKREWPTGRDIPPHEVEHSGAAPQRRAQKRSAEARSAGEPIGFLQAARTLAEIKKSEKPAEHRYKLSSAEIAVVGRGEVTLTRSDTEPGLEWRTAQSGNVYAHTIYLDSRSGSCVG
jgi:hypothetical protein